MAEGSFAQNHRCNQQSPDAQINGQGRLLTDDNIAGQYLRTDAEIGYVVTDIEGHLEAGMGIRRELENIDGTIRTRFLY